MLKIRVMPTLLHKEVGLVKGVAFDSWRRVGAAMQAVKVYNLRQVDELVFLDIAATASGNPPDFAAIDELADECFMPMTVGGGVRTADDVHRLLRVGADKIAVNTAAIDNPALIPELAARFGTQCVVVSIDARREVDGSLQVHSHCGTRPRGMRPAEWAQRAEQLGAGEIMLTSIDRDGTLRGYDLDLIGEVCAAVRIPVIASGGAGSYEHFAQALRAGASAVAAASMFHFTEQTPLEAKHYLAAAGFPVRS